MNKIGAYIFIIFIAGTVCYSLLKKEKRLSGFYRWRAVRTQNRIGHLPGDYGNDAGSKYVYKIGPLRLLYKTYNAFFYKYRYSSRTYTFDNTNSAVGQRVPKHI